MNKKNAFKPGLMTRKKTGNSAWEIWMSASCGISIQQHLKPPWKKPVPNPPPGM